MYQVVHMNELATFVVINVDQDTKIPEDLVSALKKNGWMMVRKNSIFVLPWEKTLEQNGKDVKKLVSCVENVRLTLRKLGMRYKIRTMGEGTIPT